MGPARGGTPLAGLDTVKIALPEDLTSHKTKTYTFKYNCSDPALVSSWDCKIAEELVCALTLVLEKNFSIKISPEVILGKDSSQHPDTKHNIDPTLKVIVVGASIVGQLTPLLKSSGLHVIDLTVPGWLPTPPNLTALRDKLMPFISEKNNILILDLLSNCTVRFEQFDGTLCMAQKMGNHFHLPGSVKVADDVTVERVLASILPVIQDFKGHKVFLPPLPRYLFSGCCQNPSHCTNRSEPNYGLGMLDGLTRIRNLLKSKLQGKVGPSFRILDTLAAISGHRLGDDRPGNRELLPLLAGASSSDQVHLKDSGSRYFAKYLFDYVQSYVRSAAADSVSGQPNKRSYYWRGFTSPCGSCNRTRTMAVGPRRMTTFPPAKKRR